VILGALAAIALGLTVPLGVIAGLALAYAAASIVHLVFGSPGGRPTEEQVTESLSALGIDVAAVGPAKLEPRGVALMEATTANGRSLLVKVYGRDAWDGQLLNTTWSYLWYRDDAPNLTLNRLQQVEHEAFVTLLAERASVPVETVLAAGMTDEDAVLVMQATGRWLREVPDEQVSDELLRGLWDSVGRLHDAGIAHGTLDVDHIVVRPDGGAALAGFGGATAAASDAQMASDRAQLLVATALLVGDDRAVDAARARLGADGLAASLPFIQSAALTRVTRTAIKHMGKELDGLRDQAATAAGTEAPKLEPLRRVTLGSVLLLVLLAFAAWAIVSALADVGLATLVAELQGADGTWITIALVVSLLVQVAEAFSTIGACPLALRLGPAIGLQFAIRFIALTVPSSAGRVALNVRFFQRAGLATSGAVAVGLVDSVAGFVVQVLLVLGIWLAGLVTLTISLNGVSIDISPQLVLAIVILCVVAVAVAVFVPKVRKAIAPRLADAREALRVLKTPTKVLQLFLGNLVAQVILAIVLSMCVRAFGAHVSLAEAILVNTLASLLSGVIPVPGGIGVMEGAIAAGLVAVGVSDPVAVSAALTFRMITFYLPPIWGGYAMRSLKQRGYL